MTATFVTLAVALAAPAAGAAAPASVAAGAAVTTRASCVYVTIAGKRTCLAVGRSCKRRYERRYNSKGFTCKRNAAGSYRLRRLRQSF